MASCAPAGRGPSRCAACFPTRSSAADAVPSSSLTPIPVSSWLRPSGGETLKFIQRHGRGPRVILLANHGLIALGATPQAVLAATLMADKAARIFTGAASVGAPRFLSATQVARIAGRPDEHYRQKALGL